MSSQTPVAAAGPRWVRNLVEGPRQWAAVVHSGPHAIYFSVNDGIATRCVGVLSARSSLVPCGMRTTRPELSDILVSGGAPTPGDVATIGGGTLEVGSTSVRVGRTVDTSMPPLDWTVSGDMSQALRASLEGRASLAGRTEAVCSELSSSSLALLEEGDRAAVPMLLGRGSGLTPVGDDVLAGWLAIIGVARPGPCPVALDADRMAEQATTLLSSTLLHRAVAGDVLPEFRQLVLHLRKHVETGTTGELDTVVDRLLAIGHTSGAGMLLGGLIALDHLTQSHPTARKSQT